MTNVQVPATWIEQGYLPRVCARHGGPATTTKPRTHYTRTSPWLILLILVSLVIALIVMLVLRKSVKGPLPVCDRCIKDRQNYVAASWSAWLLALVFAVVAVSGLEHAWIGSWLFVLALLAGIVLLCVKDRIRVVGTLDKEQIWVELRGVHESFAQLVNQAVQANPAQGASYGQQPGGYGQPPATYQPSAAAPGPTILPGG